MNNWRGPKTRAWEQAWKQLKRELEAAGITSCEFLFRGCTRTMFLTPAHSRKRREIENEEQLREVAVACVNCHRKLDEEMSHEEMWRHVTRVRELRQWKITR
jgi:hypothetical protein